MTEDRAWVDVISGLEEEDLVTEEIIDKLIAEHEKAIKLNRSEIKKSQRSIENLEFKKKKLKYGDNTIIFEIADSLHSKQCRHPHEDVCGWYYSSWDKFLSGDRTRQSYYDKAKNLVNKAKELGISIRKTMKLIHEI